MQELISDAHRQQQVMMHEEKEKYGTSSKNFVGVISHLASELQTNDILDYGCGKGLLQQNLPFAIKQYDPAIKVHSLIPEPADIVVCTDVMEHVEPHLLENVIKHIASLTKLVAFFVIDGNEAKKTMPMVRMLT